MNFSKYFYQLYYQFLYKRLATHINYENFNFVSIEAKVISLII
jgi:hypothetical protein